MKKRFISMAMALLFIASLPVSAFAETYDISVSGVDVNVGSDGVQNVTYNSVTSQDAAPVITGKSDTNTVTITAAEWQTANVTFEDLHIDTSSKGTAAVSTNGEGNVNIELEKTNELTSGSGHAGLEKNNEGDLIINDEDGDGSLTAQGGIYGAGIGGGFRGIGDNIIINNGDINATGGDYGAGIGGGYEKEGNNIIINNGDIDATGGKMAAGIGGGYGGKLTSKVVISGDAKVTSTANKGYDGGGAAIGNGAYFDSIAYAYVNGEEVEPDTSKLTKNGIVELSSVNVKRTIIGSYVPPVAAKFVSKTDSQTVKLYRVVDKDGKDISYTAEVKDGVLTVKVDADYAALTGTLAGMTALKAQGVESISFVTSGATSSFVVADLLAKGSVSDSYKLTHDGATVTFTLGTTDISEILK